MAKLKTIIDQCTKEECLQRGFHKLKYAYDKPINNAFDSVYQNQVATYTGCRQQDLFFGICFNEHERLYKIFWDKVPPFAYKKNETRLCVIGTSLRFLMKKETGESEWFEVYDQYPEKVPETVHKMFLLADCYAPAYFNEMADVERFLDYFERGNPYSSYVFKTLPLLYLATGQRHKAEEYLLTVKKSGEYISKTHDFIQFCEDFSLYDYDTDPDKLPIA